MHACVVLVRVCVYVCVYACARNNFCDGNNLSIHSATNVCMVFVRVCVCVCIYICVCELLLGKQPNYS